eukprot:1826542-Amphidinium_carterae.1
MSGRSEMRNRCGSTTFCLVLVDVGTKEVCTALMDKDSGKWCSWIVALRFYSDFDWQSNAVCVRLATTQRCAYGLRSK